MQETFVLQDIEVKKTGRTANKPGVRDKQLVLIEVTPVNEYDGTWKKWVPQQSLFTINEQGAS